MSANVADLFFAAAAQNAGALALVSRRERVTFGDLRTRVDACAAGLVGAGFRPGNRALFLVPMSVELYVSVLGALTAGGVAVFVDPWVPLREIIRLAAASEATALIGTPKAHVARLFARALRRVPVTVSTGTTAAGIIARFGMGRFAGSTPVAEVSREASALVTFTTGSSGTPKGVNRTHAILAAQHHVIRQEFPVVAGDVDLTTFPVFALSNLAAGITTLIPPINLRRISAAKPAAVLADIRAFGVTTAAASPPVFDLLAGHLSHQSAPMPPLRRIVTGGAPVRDDQLRRWRQVWPDSDIVVAYGSSEAEPVASIRADERLALSGTTQGVCVGAPVAAVRTRVARITRGALAQSSDLPPGSIGELLVAGPHVCREYIGDPAAFAEHKVRDADDVVWHRMGDTGYFDGDGRFWLVGRVHSTIRRDGVEYHAAVLESLAHGGDPRIRRVAALGVTDAVLGERLVVVVESTAPDAGPAVRARLATAGAAAPVDRLLVTDAPLPVDPRHNSKVDYTRLRALLRQRGEIE